MDLLAQLVGYAVLVFLVITILILVAWNVKRRVADGLHLIGFFRFGVAWYRADGNESVSRNMEKLGIRHFRVKGWVVAFSLPCGLGRKRHPGKST